MAKGESTKPIFTRRAWTGTASVEVAVFEKTVSSATGELRVFNVVAKRVWKDDSGFQSGNSFRPEDLLPMSLFLTEAYSFINGEQAKK